VGRTSCWFSFLVGSHHQQAEEEVGQDKARRRCAGGDRMASVIAVRCTPRSFLRRGAGTLASTSLPVGTSGRGVGRGLGRLGASAGASSITASPEGSASSSSAGVAQLPVNGGYVRRERIRDLRGCTDRIGETVTLRGWARTVRRQKQFAFLEINDGSCLGNLQVVVAPDAEGYGLIEAGHVTTGASVAITGILAESPGSGQAVEVKGARVVLLGGADAEKYPLQKKRHTNEFLREIAHLRPRTNTYGAVNRVRAALAQATHTFFSTNGFCLIQTPVVTASDAEGAGELFQVTTLPVQGDATAGGIDGGAREPHSGAGADRASLEAAVAVQGARVRDLKSSDPKDVEAIKAAVDELLRLKNALEEAGSAAAAGPYAADFFGRRAFLTCSGQLNAEAMATALGDVYTFGPTFRAENSNTTRHLAEFWMVEPELAFADLDADIACAEGYLRFCLTHVLSHCREDLEFFQSFYDKGLIQRLERVASSKFSRITYTDAVAKLEQVVASGEKTFVFPVSWGADLQSEHERYLCEEAFGNAPLVVTDYPKGIKAFYMRANEDGKTVAAMDVLVPGVGELIGGSQREERLDVLEARMRENGLEPDDYSWYLDLRRYGTVPHAGFGLGFERLVQYVTGMDNIRDVIPFPRAPGTCAF